MNATRQVPLSSIAPSGMNPRKTFSHIDKLADAIEATGGVPVNPIICVEDGGSYRIVDGERRFRALKKLHADDPDAPVPVLVLDDYDEAAEIRAMVATDSKETLTPDERNAGLQLMLKLDVPSIDITLLSGVSADRVDAARDYSSRHPQALEVPMMTLDTLASMAEADLTEEEAERVMDAKYPDVGLQNVMNARIGRDRREKMVACAEEAGVRWVDEPDRSGVPDDVRGLAQIGYANTPKKLQEVLGAIRDKEAAVVTVDYAGWCQVYGRSEDKPPDHSPEYTAAVEAGDKAGEARDALLVDVLTHLANYWATGMREPPRHLAAWAKGFRQSYEMPLFAKEELRVDALQEIVDSDQPNIRDLIINIYRLRRYPLVVARSWSEVVRPDPDIIDASLSVLDAADEDGVALSDAARALPGLVEAATEAAEATGGDDDDDD